MSLETQKLISKKRKHRTITELNLLQNVFMEGTLRGTQYSDCVTFHSGTSVLPVANWATIMSRAQRWSVFSGAGTPGEHVLGSDPATRTSIRSAIVAIPRIVLVFSKDSVSANQAWVRHEQQLCRDLSLGTERKIPVVSVDCIQHQCCLVKKPAMCGLGSTSVPTALVRMCHVLDSSTFARQFIEVLHAIVENPHDGFKYYRVAALPIDVPTWRAKNARLMKYATNDLKDGVIEVVLDFLNCIWSPDHTMFKMCHFCLGAPCCRDEEHAKQKCKDFLTELFGSHPSPPLIYRWKGFEPANSFAFRGKAIFNIIKRVLSVIRRALGPLDPNLLQLALLDDTADVTFAVRNAVRCTKTEAFFEDPKCFALLAGASLMNEPISDMMNKNLSVDKHLNEYKRLVSGVPNAKDNREQLINDQAFVISGDAGWDVINKYEEVLELPLDDDLWTDFDVVREDDPLNMQMLEDICYGLMQCQCESYKRLVMRFRVSPWPVIMLGHRSHICCIFSVNASCSYSDK